MIHEEGPIVQAGLRKTLHPQQFADNRRSGVTGVPKTGEIGRHVGLSVVYEWAETVPEYCGLGQQQESAPLERHHSRTMVYAKSGSLSLATFRLAVPAARRTLRGRSSYQDTPVSLRLGYDWYQASSPQCTGLPLRSGYAKGKARNQPTNGQI